MKKTKKTKKLKVTKKTFKNMQLEVKVVVGDFAPKDSEPDEECEFCGGEGFIAIDEDDGEGNTRKGVGSRRCICRDNFNEDDQDD